MDNFLILHKERIITNADLAKRNKLFADWFNSIWIGPSKISLNLTSGKLLIIDPIYLADIYNKNDTKEKYLKSAGVLLTDFGGDVSGPVVRTESGGIKIVLVFDRMDDEGRPIFRQDPIDYEYDNEAMIDSEDFGCDSGSYIFLDYNQEFKSLFGEIDSDLSHLTVELKPGIYNVGYEQWEVDQKNRYEAWRRNIVVWPAV